VPAEVGVKLAESYGPLPETVLVSVKAGVPEQLELFGP
jgi:hypothetical protein